LYRNLIGYLANQNIRLILFSLSALTAYACKQITTQTVVTTVLFPLCTVVVFICCFCVVRVLVFMLPSTLHCAVCCVLCVVCCVLCVVCCVLVVCCWMMTWAAECSQRRTSIRCVCIYVLVNTFVCMHMHVCAAA
jgi:hypothetical protein